MFLEFVVDASVTLWRRGHRGESRRGVIVGGSMIFFISARVVPSRSKLFLDGGSMVTLPRSHKRARSLWRTARRTIALAWKLPFHREDPGWLVVYVLGPLHLYVL
jgi:hypothetical protein